MADDDDKFLYGQSAEADGAEAAQAAEPQAPQPEEPAAAEG
jgi:hypothetical protein